ncbi:MAG: ATP-binding protein [Patescibacteria group bacterium]
MSFFALTALINTISSILLGFLVYFSNKKAIINKTFARFCIMVAIWSYAYFIWQISKTAGTALLWSHILMAGAIFIPITYLHFILEFLGKMKEKKKILIFGYFSFIVFFILNLTPWFINGVEQKLSFNFWPNAGLFYTPFLIFWFFYIIYPIYLLVKEKAVSVGLKRNQISFILLGTIIGYTGGITNFPLWYDISIPPIGNWATTIYLAIIAYVIVKHHLMQIKVVITEFLVGSITIILLLDAVTSEDVYKQLFRWGVFFIFIYFGYLLIKSVLNEVKRGDELEVLTKKLKEANKDLKKLDKAKSEFLSIASHQLRTPLTAIKGYISLMLEKNYGKVPEKMVRPLENVFQSNERLLSLVNDLLNLSRLNAGKTEFTTSIISLEKLTSDIVEELKINANKKGIYINIEKPSKSLPNIIADRDKLRQIILNIIDNAIKYTDKGGITIRFNKTLSTEKISISDTGSGMEKEEIDNVFKMFTRATAGVKNNTGGSGVGLYVAKKFIDMHNGKVWIESQGEDKGTTFHIELPIKQIKK